MDQEYKSFILVKDRPITTIINHDNNSCYFIISVQLLHCSKILEDLLIEHEKELLEDFPTLFAPIISYNRLTKDKTNIENIDKTISQIEQSFENSPQLTGDGYSWNRLLSCFYFPIILKLVNNDEDKLIDILREMYILPDYVVNAMSVDYDKILRKEEKEKLIPYVSNYINRYQSIRRRLQERNKSNPISIRLFPLETYQKTKEGKVHGHVFTAVIGNDDNLYTIDVDVIEPLRYHIDNYKNIDKIRFSSLQNEEIIKRLQKEFGEGESSQYSFNWYIKKSNSILGGNKNIDNNDFIGLRKITDNEIDNNIDFKNDNNMRFIFISILSFLFVCLLLCICIYLCSLYPHNSCRDRKHSLSNCRR